MRKDVRLGAAIGGILIAVLIVYGIVVSKNQPKKTDVVIDNPKASPTGGDAADGTGPAAPADPAEGTPLPAAGTDPAAAPPDGATPAPGAPVSGAAPLLHAESTAAPTAGGAHRAADWSSLLRGDVTETPGGDIPAANLVSHAEHHARVIMTAGGHDTTPASPMAADPAPSDSPTPKNYTIKTGDTFSSIAKDMYGDSRYYKQIMKANPKVDPARLHPGVRIALPDRAQLKHSAADSGSQAGPDSDHASSHKTVSSDSTASATQYRVQSSDNLYKISMKLYHTPNKIDAIYQLNKTAIGADPAKLKLNMILKLPEPPTQTASR